MLDAAEGLAYSRERELASGSSEEVRRAIHDVPTPNWLARELELDGYGETLRTAMLARLRALCDALVVCADV
jgi:hypothetical protein